MTKRERAIEAIVECRSIHVWYLRQMRDPAWGRKRLRRNQAAGGRQWHQKWVKNYDMVLEVLHEDTRVRVQRRR